MFKFIQSASHILLFSPIERRNHRDMKIDYEKVTGLQVVHAGFASVSAQGKLTTWGKSTSTGLVSAKPICEYSDLFVWIDTENLFLISGDSTTGHLVRLSNSKEVLEGIASLQGYTSDIDKPVFCNSATSVFDDSFIQYPGHPRGIPTSSIAFKSY